MAEAVFRKLVEEEGLSARIAIDSAGLGAWHVGEPPHRGTRRVLASKGIPCDGLTARQIRREDLEKFDYIVAMDEDNLEGLRRLDRTGQHRQKISLLLDYAPELGYREVPDPYFTGRFEEVFDLVSAGCRGLLEHIRHEHHL
jgi:protein-tyrosine phosphatase